MQCLLPLHIICIQSPYDMYPSMIVRENSHVKRARSQQHTDTDPYQLLWSISALIATRSSTIYMHGVHPTNWCLNKRVCTLFSIFCICLKFCLHGISLNTRVYKDSTRSKVFIYICDTFCELMSDDIDAPSSFDQHLCTWCAHLLALSTLMYHKTSITKTTHVHTSYQVTLVCIMLCQSIRMCLWRVDFRYPSSNFRYPYWMPRDVAVISIGNGQWSYNWYPRIVIISHASSAPFEW